MRGQLLLHVQPLGAAPATVIERCPVTNKQRFSSEDEALEAAFEFSQANRFVFSSHDGYECRHCGGWHLTSRRTPKSFGVPA